MIIIADYTQEKYYTLEELSEFTGLSTDALLELIAHDIIRQEQERFNVQQLKRLQIATRLQRDLEINLAGVGLALSLMEEIESLRERITLLDKHILK
jgi:chaperone modulatory protein CbpM